MKSLALRQGHLWGSVEDEILMQQFEAGANSYNIAKFLQRSVGAIMSRLVILEELARFKDGYFYKVENGVMVRWD